MAEIDPTQFSGFPYYDDYSDAKKFVKMLFKPGYALQARELTQIQTLLQKQISRFANHVFKDGSPVLDGQLAVIDAKYIRVKKQFPNANGVLTDVTPAQLNGKIFENLVPSGSSTPVIRMKVLHVDEATEVDPYHVLFVEYSTSVTVTDPNTGELKNQSSLEEIYDYYNTTGNPDFSDNEITLVAVGTDSTTGAEILTDIRCYVKSNRSDNIATFGSATLVSNREGIYYIDGAFILASPQTIALSRTARLQSDILGITLSAGEPDRAEGEWSSLPGEATLGAASQNGWTWVDSSLVGVRLYNLPSSRVGFTILREVIDADADQTLLDPAYGSYNYSAPGADRYKVDLVLDQLLFTNKDALEDSDQYKTNNFIELTRVVDGKVQYSVKYPVYSELEETLARRTYDESGSYTVKPFEIDIQEYFKDEKVCVFRTTPKEITGNSPYEARTNEGGNPIEAYPQHLTIYGYRTPVGGGADFRAWQAIVSNRDTFLNRQGEVDFRAEGYGTTLLYMVFGTPEPGDIMVSEGYTKNGIPSPLYYLRSTIPSVEDVREPLGYDARKVQNQTTGLFEPYETTFTPVSTFLDKRFDGRYTIARLHPEWASDETLDSQDVVDAIVAAKSKLSVGVGTGKAYIFGYEFENQNTKFLDLDKARDVETVNGENLPAYIGNYVVCVHPTGTQEWTPTTPVPSMPSFASLPKVELWNAKNSDGTVRTDGSTQRVGTARIRGVEEDRNTANESVCNVFLFDVQLEQDRYFQDFDQIRYRVTNITGTSEVNDGITGTMKLFDIDLTGGTFSLGIDNLPASGPDGVIDSYIYDTVLFGTKINSAIVDLPSLCSVSAITEFGVSQFDVAKTFDKTVASEGSSTISAEYLSMVSYPSNAAYILSNVAGSGLVLSDVKQQTKTNTKYTWTNIGGGLPGTTTLLSNIFYGNDASSQLFRPMATAEINNLSLFNATTGQRIALANNAEFQIATDTQSSTKLFIVYTGADANVINGKYLLQATLKAQVVGDSNTIDFRKKSMKVISEYESRTATGWDKYFDDNGYFMVPLQNWNGVYAIQQTQDSDPFIITSDWSDWTVDDNNFSSAPEEIVTSLGVSDVTMVTEVLCWDSSTPTKKRDITEFFELDNGQTDNVYDHAKISIKKSVLQALKGQYGDTLFVNDESGTAVSDYTLFVRFKFFEHSGSGPFTVNSYDHSDHHPTFDQYEDIPLYTSVVYGTTYELRNCIDYRPSRQNATPAVVATALADESDATPDSTTNRPHALDKDAPFRDNSLLDSTNGSVVLPINRSDSNTIIFALGPEVHQKPSTSYEYFTSRTDKLILRKNRKFEIIKGKPGIRPQSPKDIPESMSLYNFVVPQYTFGPDDVSIDYIDNKRYTMNDIAKLEKRIERVEYYTTLSLLEKEAAELSVPDPSLNGVERIKNGIFVDNFKGHGVGDVFNPYYSCAMDFEKGHLRPRFISSNIEFVSSIATSPSSDQFVVSPDGVVTLAYDDTAPNRYIVQPLASKAISVNPFDVVSWLGSANVSPSSDTWIDTNTKPSVVVNLEGENDAWLGMQNAFGTQWNDWETNWSGVVASTTENLGEKTTSKFLDAPHTRRAPDGVMRRRNETTTTRTKLVTETIDSKQTRTGVKTTITPQRVTKELGDRIVDVSVVPFMRERTLTVTATGMKPNTVVYAFFDNIGVNKYCTLANGSSVTTANPIKTDGAGSITGLTFRIPPGTFKTGEKQFRLTDSPTNNPSDANTTAECSYFAQGLLQTKENTIVSTRVPVIKRQTVTEEKTVRDVVTRVQTDSSTSIKWVDPLAQTFLVDASKNPKGVWMHSVDLFFKNKPTSNIPVRVQIRPTVNGYPHSSMVIPFAECLLNADEVKVVRSEAQDGSDTPNISKESTYTRFKFSTPVYLMPGEYAVVVMSNSNEYECYVAEMGQNVVGTTNRITQQPYAGVFFKSQNASTWSADQNIDLMFALNTCVFVTGGSSENPLIVDFVPITGSFPSGTVLADVVKVVSQYLRFDGTTVTAKITTPSNSFEVPLNENYNAFPVPLEINETTKIQFCVTNTDPSLSPSIDTDRVSCIAVHNIIGDPTSPLNQTEEYAARPDGKRPVARYISRRVELIEGLECDDIKVYLSANLPNFTVDGETVNTSVEVWAKIQTGESDTPFDDVNWMRMEVNPLQANQIATDEVTFKEYSFSMPEKYWPTAPDNLPRTGYNKLEQSFAVPVTRYSIKVVLYSTTSTVVPKVKDLRVIAVV